VQCWAIIVRGLIDTTGVDEVVLVCRRLAHPESAQNV